MKKIFSLFIASIVFSMVVAPVLAEDTTTTNTSDTTNTTENTTTNTTHTTNTRPILPEKMHTTLGPTIKAERTEKITTNLNDRAENEINRRIDSLKNLLTRISEFKKLSDAQKATLTSEVQAQIDSLTALLAKIKADTDTATLKADVKSIVDSYRIYALFMPQIQIIGSADRMLSIADEMSSYSAKLQTKITDAKNSGKDTTDLELLLSDMNAKVADAKIQAQNAINTVAPLTPDGFPGNKTILQSARQMVVTAFHDLNDARQDGRKIIVGLLKFGLHKEGTPTVTVTLTP